MLELDALCAVCPKNQAGGRQKQARFESLFYALAVALSLRRARLHAGRDSDLNGIKTAKLLRYGLTNHEHTRYKCENRENVTWKLRTAVEI